MALIDTIQTQYVTLATQYGNGQAEGYNGYTVNGNEVLFQEANGGEGFTVNIDELQLSEAEMAELKAAQATKETTAAKETEETGSTAEIEERIANLEAEKEAKMADMEAIEAQIQELAEDIEEKIATAAKVQEAKVEEHKEEVQKAIENNVAQYISDKKAGKQVTQDDLQSNINASLAGLGGIADVVSNLFVANSELNVLDTQLGLLSDMANDISSIDTQIATENTNLEAAKAAEEAAKSESRCCDPIGFTDAEGNTFDFVVMDEDGFNTTSDFLGAEGQWDAMKALDTTGAEDGGADGKVTIDELRTAGIGLVMNGKDGNKEIMDADKIAEMFGDDFTIDLNSYNNGGEHDAVSAGDHDGDGVADQNLLGTFTVSGSKNLGADNTAKGYNTLDDQDWLTENYGLEADVLDENGEVAATAQEVGEEKSDELATHMEFIEQYKEKAEQLRTDLENQWALYNLDTELLELIDNSAAQVAEAETAEVDAEIEAEQQGEVAETEEVPENNEGDDEDPEALKKEPEEV